MNLPDYLQKAVVVSRQRPGGRKYLLGAVALRSDGALVTSVNGAARRGAAAEERMPRAHAEARLCRKLDFGSEVYVARTLKDGTIAMARPCRTCQQLLRAKGVVRVYYTVKESEYGVLIL